MVDRVPKEPLENEGTVSLIDHIGSAEITHRGYCQTREKLRAKQQTCFTIGTIGNLERTQCQYEAKEIVTPSITAWINDFEDQNHNWL